MVLAASPVLAQPTRVALVVGVAHYQSANALANTVGDARLVAQTLQGLGFTVKTVIDPTRTDLVAAIGDLARQAAGADAAIVYFAGHGAEVAGVNYLFPRDANSASMEGMIASGLEATKVREAVARAHAVRLVILDACRNLPEGAQGIVLKAGLARETGGMTAQVVTLMAAAPGQAALDGQGDHSPFALALTQALKHPRLTVGELPRLVQSDVQVATRDRQSPDLQGIWVDIYWTFDGKAAARPKGDDPDRDARDRSKREKAFWETIRNSSDPDDFQAYIDDSDRGDFAGFYRSLAVTRLQGVRRQPAAAATAAGAPGSAQAAAARTAYMNGDYPAALRGWSAAAAAGNGAARYNLGVLYSIGRGVAKDPGQAARWYAQAAQAGNLGGMVNYGLCLLEGVGVAKNQAEGVRWLRRAADAGLPYAIGLVGQLYLQGEGVGRDPRAAAGWLRRAADAGDGPSMVDLGEIYEKGEGVRQDKQAALTAYQRAASAGQGAAMVRLGYFYEDGDGVAKDPVQAATWYQRAAEADEAEGMSALGVMLESGRGLPQDYGRAAASYRQAANRGDARGLLGLGNLYAQGKGVVRDDGQAVLLFQKAADAGSPEALRNLGLMYEGGHGVPRDVAKATDFYRRAASAGDAGAAQELARITGR